MICGGILTLQNNTCYMRIKGRGKSELLKKKLGELTEACNYSNAVVEVKSLELCTSMLASIMIKFTHKSD